VATIGGRAPVTVDDPIAAEQPPSGESDIQSTLQLPRVVFPGHNVFDQKQLMHDSDSAESPQSAVIQIPSGPNAGLAAPAPPLPPQPEDVLTADDDSDSLSQPPLPDDPVPGVGPFSLSTGVSASLSHFEGNRAAEGGLQHARNQLFRE
jgi:hypothetical protein